MSIDIRGINKRFGNFTALDNVNLSIATGELVALLGPSGCGKTTLLRIIAGLETADSGSILFHGKAATDRHVRDRQVGFVFQHYALFRHMTVFENVAFGLRVRPRKQRLSEAAIGKKVRSLLELVQLDWLADRYPSQLSGGQRQRIALARALAVEPRLLLLDEPFGALDAKVRKELRLWLRHLHDEIHVTSVFVTHDQEEALEVADRIVVVNKGHIEQVGTPDEVYQTPANPFVYGFLGSVNLFHGRAGGGWASAGGLYSRPPERVDDEENVPRVAYVRPHDIELSRTALPDALTGQIEEVRRLGALTRLVLRHGDEAVEVELPSERYRADPVVVGETVFFRPRQARVFPAAAVEAEAGDYVI